MSDRDFDLYPSVLSGDIGMPGDSKDNCFHVMFFPSTSDAVVDGFTIRSGTANGSTSTANESSYVSALFISIPNYRVGGIYMHNESNINIVNCNLTHNRSTYDGGAMYIAGGSHEFSNCRFTGNMGGAMVVPYMPGKEPIPSATLYSSKIKWCCNQVEGHFLCLRRDIGQIEVPFTSKMET